jgi:DNA-binding CsgD family transcriptional regulator
MVDLVGRDSELAAVERAVQAVRGGESRVVLISGEPGIGKTALLQAAAERAGAAGLTTLSGRAAEHEREVPFALAVAALDDHVASLHPRRVEALGPALGAVLPAAAHGVTPPAAAEAAAERFRYHRALRALVELLARERPLALALDDLHWADDASLEFIQHLLRRPPRAPHLLVLALRSADPSVPTNTLDPRLEHLHLGPLGPDEALALLGDAPDRERIVREARGNPLFLHQLARSGTGVPPCVTAAIGVELDLLPHASRVLIEGAAVAGDPFDPELAAVGAGLDARSVTEPLDRLVAADLVRATGNGRGFAFRHPLVRTAVYDAAPPAWRLGAHERIAGALAARGANAGVRAHHVEQFARPGDATAIELLAEAAAAAAETAPATAARWYAAALELVPDNDAPRRAELRAPMALALAAAGRLLEARDTLVDVLAVFGERLELVAACAAMEKQLGRPEDARRRLLAAYDSAPDADRPALALQLGSVASCFGAASEIRMWAERARLAHEPALRASAEGTGAIGALWDGDPEMAHTRRERAGARLRALEDAALVPHLDAAVQVGMAEFLTERFDASAATVARGLALARRSGQSRLLVPLSIIGAGVHTERLDLDTAWRHAEDAAESEHLQGVPHMRALVLRARLPIHELRGEWPEATAAVDEAAELVPSLSPSYATRTLRALAGTLHAEHDPERCIHELEPLVDIADVTLASRMLLALVRSALALGRIEDAERWARRCSDHAEALQLPAGTVRGACARAEVLLARGDAAAAATVALGAAAAADRAGARRDEAVAGLLAGRALAAAGQSEPAKAALRKVGEDGVRGGAHALVGEAARELRRLGSRLPGPKTSSGDLSERERDVSRLVVQGRSNKEVAAALFLSEKTIESTLTRVYAKLGVRSRVELTRRLTPV